MLQGIFKKMIRKLKLKTKKLPQALLVLNLLTICITPVFAEDLKNISQMAEQGQQGAALDHINAYLVKNPKDAQAMFMKGVFLAELGKREEATKTFIDLTEKYPNLPEPYNNLAVLYADAGQYDKAQKALETAIRTHPSYATAHENLGDIYARRASEAYDKALQLDTGNTRAQNKLALIKDLFGSNANQTSIVAKPTANTAIAKDISTAPALPTKAVEASKQQVKTLPTEVAVESGVTKVVANNNNSDVKQITETVEAWAQAWSAKDINQYLANYSKSFKTPKGESRKQWEQTRRERVSRPARIKVEIANIKITMQASNMATASFRQTYNANGSAQRTIKTLAMKKVGGSWLIDQESTSN